MVARSLGRAQKKKKKKEKSNDFSLLEKKCFHVRLQISSWYFCISGVAWKWKQLCRKGFRGEFVGVWILSLLVLPGFRQNWEFLLQKLKSAQGFEPTPCPSLGPCCRGRITRSLPLKTEKHTQRLIHPLPLDKVDKGKFKTSAHFRRCHFSRFAYLPTAIAAYNKLKAARTKLSVVNPIKAGTSWGIRWVSLLRQSWCLPSYF